ncbi:MAG: hypothetical protein IJ770_03595 [Alphaproteobacteria bacterium]|nr:hypothetical protein [Alphaproteobacteria bacterium]
MNEIWRNILRQSKIKAEYRKRHHKYKIILLKGTVILMCLHLLFPQYGRRILYSFLLGKPTAEIMRISKADTFEDITAAPFRFQRGKYTYTLVPHTKYSVTGRVGIVDDYTTLFNQIFRGQFQGEYINLVPRDVVLVIGKMAEPTVFAMFEFIHEERMGGPICKGVKYRTSFLPSFMSAKKAEKNWQKYRQCNQYIKAEEYNNYHPIPANERINKALSMLLPNDVVHLEGILVDVPQMGLSTGTRKEQTHHNMTVNGYTPGKCFILYTTKVILNNCVYE